MTAENIYEIAKELDYQQKIFLYNMLKKDIDSFKIVKPKKRPVLTDEEAIEYLFKNVFGKIR